jgi:hypothetical protein
MAHVADRILAAVLANLVAVPGVVTADIKPLDLLEEGDLPALIIDEVEDDVEPGEVGFFPVEQTRKLKFVVLACVMASASSTKAQLADLHEQAELALVGTEAAVRLGGLLTRGLKVHGGSLSTDSESIQKPVGVWRISVSCTYNLRSDAPGKTEKE